MVKIRLSRFGSKKRPYYHLVVSDSEAPRDGKFLEQIGTYDPRKDMSEARVDLMRFEHWRGMGAEATNTIKKLVRERRKALAASSVV